MTPWWLITLATLVAGPPDTALVNQREAVLRAASQVEDARRTGARRAEVKQLMASYREAAEVLEGLERQASGDSAAEAHLKAQIALGTALAEGRADDASRGTLATWLGEPEARLKALRSAVETAYAVDPGPVQDAILLDVLDQSQALALALRYDAAQADAEASRLTLKARNLERATVPGQSAGAAGAAEARRLLEDARGAEARRDRARTLATEAESLRERVQSPLELSP